jgi:two-component system cell cycle response regulator DivK
MLKILVVDDDPRADRGPRPLKGNDETRSIPVIALTALAMKGDEQRIRDAGCDGYIAKPIRYQELLQTVATQLARH